MVLYSDSDISFNLTVGEYFLHIFLSTDTIHPAINKISAICLKNIKTYEQFIIPINNQDKINNIDLSILNKDGFIFYVSDKKLWEFYFGENQIVYDIPLLCYFNEKFFKEFELSSIEKFHKLNYGTIYYDSIPCLILLNIFNDLFNRYKNVFELEKSNGYFKLNQLFFKNFCEIEKNGLFVDIDNFVKHFNKPELVFQSKVYSQYNLYTSTGRPSNRFGGINYSALKKESGCRESFISRFGNDGKLLMFDYSSFHPRLISYLIDHPIDYSIDAYEYFSNELYGESSLDIVKEVKIMIFEMLYGGIENKLSGLDYFKKVNLYISSLWENFNNVGYIKTPIFKRKISNLVIKDPTPNKVFNYLLQAFEFEFGIFIIDKINQYLKTNNISSKLILYTYDSLLFDINLIDINHFKKVREIMEYDKRFPTKLYIGENYDSLYKI